LTESSHGPDNKESVQIAVADLGIGIGKSLSVFHPDVAGDSVAALQKAMRPFVSGMFEEGGRGSIENAGLGLFFLTRIAKLLGGRMILATVGGTICIDGVDSAGHLRQTVIPEVGFPGTLIVLEIPREIPVEYSTQAGVIQAIRERDLPGQSPIKRGSVYWISYADLPEDNDFCRIVVQVGASDFASIQNLVDKAEVGR
jgi:hypothetical protein